MKPTIRTQRSERCQVAELLNQGPKKPPAPSFAKRNIEALRKQQTENRTKKEEEENKPPRAPFKIKRFTRVGPVVYNPQTDGKKPRGTSAPHGAEPKVVTYDSEDQGVASDHEEKPQALHSEYGKVPQYLERYKEERQAKEDQRRHEAEQASCPSGMRLMSEEERLETLELLRNGKAEVWSALNKLPIASNTPSIIRRRNEYERKLDEIESGLQTFSRQKVYIAL
jgi:hypothetical protein